MPRSNVELAAPVKLSAPAEDKARVPEVVVERVNGPESTVSVSPLVDGPVISRALLPEKVKLPPKVVKLLPETVKVLSKVVAPCKVKPPGVVVEPITLTEEAPVPKEVLPVTERA